MPGSGFGGIAEGLWGSIAEGRKEAQRREEKAAEREAQILTTLANSDDPEIASMAFAGMLEQASPKRKAKGLRGFLGEMEASATLPKIRELLNTPVQSQVTVPGLPSRGIPQAVTMRGGPPAPSGEQDRMAAALTGQAPPVAVGAPPPGGLPPVLPQSQLGRGEPPPAPGEAYSEQRGTPEVGRVDTVTRPRQVFLQPDERLRRNTLARERAEVEGEVEGYIAAGIPREQALELVKQSRMRRGGAGAGIARAIAGLANGKPTYAVFNPATRTFDDPDTGQPIQDFAPLDRTLTSSRGLNEREAIAAELFGQPGEDAKMVLRRLPSIPGAMATVDAEMRKRGVEQQADTVTAKGQAAANIPLSTQQRFQATGDLTTEWQKVSAPLKTIQEQNAALKAGMEAARRGDLAAGAEAVRVTFSKILDPNSVVMPGEFLRGNAALSWAAWVKGKIEQAQQGGIAIPLSDLETYAKLASDIEAAYGTFLEQERTRVQKAATDFGVDPAHVFGSAQTPTMQQGKPALPTTVPSAAAPPQASTKAPVTPAELREWMTLKSMTEAQAIADLQRRGYTLAPAPQ